MEYHSATRLMPVPVKFTKQIKYGDGRFLEIHLDERFYIGEDHELFYATPSVNGAVGIDINKKIFYDSDQCIDFISSYEWRKIFLTLSDKFTDILPLIHDLPQIVYIYIYSEYPDQIFFDTTIYPKLRAIVHEDSPNADDQLLADIEIFKRDLLPINVVQPIERKAKLFTNDKLKDEDVQTEMNDMSIIWIYDDDDDKTMINTSFIENKINSIKKFFNVDKCFDYINSLHNNIKIFFISSKSNNDFISSTLINQKSIQFIYIFQTKERIDAISQELLDKIRGTYSDGNDLFNKLLKDYNEYLNDSQMPISIFDKDKNEKTVRNLQEDNARFVWFQLLVDILIKIPDNHQTLEEMLDECEKYEAKHSSTQTKIISKELRENYQSDKALQYYTGASFLYHRFNRAFRTENIDFLFVFRFFLTDMYNQLRNLYREQFLNDITNCTNHMDLYRGQSMKSSEFDIIKHNINHLISINTFFSTTKDYSLACVFAGYESKDEERSFEQISVVFQIEIDDMIHSLKRPFASLKVISKVKDEEEVLFSIGTVFRIEEVENVPGSDKNWYVLLKLINDDDSNELSELRNNLERDYCLNPDLSSLGAVLIKMGEYDKAERYFQMIVEHFTESQDITPRIYLYLGIINDNKGYYQKALEYQQKALQIYTGRCMIYDHREEIGNTYTHIGSSYHNLGSNHLALEYFTKANEIQKSPRKVSYTCNQIALIHQENGDYQQALEYFQKALKIDEDVLKLDKYHPLLATTYNNIGDTYSRMGEYDEALKYLQHALDIRLKGTVSTHTDLAAVYHNLGGVYHDTNCLEQALENYEKALAIDTQALPENHPSLVKTHISMCTIYIDQCDFSKALHHAETALRMVSKSNTKDDKLLAACHHQIASVHLALGHCTQALSITKKLLENQTEFLPENHHSFASTHNLIGEIYFAQNDFSNALYHAETAVRIMLKTNVKDNELLARYQSNLASIHISLNNYEKALNMANKASEAAMKCLHKNSRTLSVVYSCLTKIYKKQNNISKASEYFQKYTETARLCQNNSSLEESLMDNEKPSKIICQPFEELCDPDKLDETLAIWNQKLQETPLDNISNRICILNSIGVIHSRNSNHDAALKVFDAAISLYKQNEEFFVIKDHELESLMIQVYFNLARAQYRQQNWTCTSGTLQKSLQFALKHDQQNRLVPEMYNLLALTMAHLHDYRQSEYLFKLAVKTAEKILPVDHPDLQRYRAQLKQLQDQL